MKATTIELGIPIHLVLIVDKANDLHASKMPVLQKAAGEKTEWPIPG